MKTIKLKQFAAHSEGATAIEYAVMASGIGMAILGAVGTLGSNLVVLYSSIAAATGV